MAESEVLQGYADHAEDLIARFEALAPREVLGPVLDLLPRAPCRILDIGAGTGRDAAWLAGQGNQVLAVEPVRALRCAGERLHAGTQVRWLDDHLPDLARTLARGVRFDAVLGVGVWQHLPSAQHAQALVAIARLTLPGARVLLSLRRGPGPASRPCFPADPQRVTALAKDAGLERLALRRAASVQAQNRRAGVTWDWLCLERR